MKRDSVATLSRPASTGSGCPVKRGLQHLAQRLAELCREEWSPLLAGVPAPARPALESAGQRLEARLISAALACLDEVKANAPPPSR